MQPKLRFLNQLNQNTWHPPFLSVFTGYRHPLARHRSGRNCALLLYPVSERPQRDDNDQDKDRSNKRSEITTCARQGPQRRRTPDARRRIETADPNSSANKHAGTKKTDPGSDLGRDSARFRRFADQGRQHHEQCGSYRYERKSADPRQALTPLAFRSNHQTAKEGTGEAN